MTFTAGLDDVGSREPRFGIPWGENIVGPMAVITFRNGGGAKF